ncbi:hypothetical protein EH240_35285 [Mesorhizobium tamadayense]|uniref:Uncharacterized protein n=1 Tax=Mesorhizobium tamadayense TaxID=425306 RepID=A0A3P3EPM2_9HYPH|nr:hypothetical protein [Mesorhizobium tamadayense]RRH88315.1 hypothetical protein EH240_35285 [Mesorhizobium tamadayense]
MDMIVQNFVGCDISKQWLDFFDEASGHYRRIDNQADAIAAYVAGLQPGRDFVVMEATGVHDRLLYRARSLHSTRHARYHYCPVCNFDQTGRRRSG